MSSAEPTTAELMRRLDEIASRLERLSDGLEEGYVRKDVMEAREIANALHFKGLEDEIQALVKRFDALKQQRDDERDERDRQRSSDRRLIYTVAFTAIVGPVIVAFLLHMLQVR